MSDAIFQNETDVNFYDYPTDNQSKMSWEARNLEFCELVRLIK